MAYIGNEPGVGTFIVSTERFNGTGSCTQFTITQTGIDDANAIDVIVNSVTQDPINSYSITDGVITFTEAPSSGTQNIIVRYRATTVITFSSITTSQILDGQITASKIASGVLPSAAANSAGVYANSAFASANLISGIDTTQNTNITNAGTYANAAFATANTVASASSYANSAFLTANTPNHTANSSASYANSGFSVANSAASYANSGFAKANSSVSLTANVSGTLPVGNGGTGASTLTVNNVILGNTTSAVKFVAPGTTGNLLTSDGTTWTSAAASGGVTSVNGQTGAVVLTNAGDIGSIGVFQNSGNADLAYAATIAGSTLRYGHSNNGGATNPSSPSFTGYRQRQNTNSYDGGGTSLSGTWRKLATEKIYATQVNCCGNLYAWYHSLYIRIS